MTPITRIRGEGALWACGPRDPHLRLHSIRRTPMIQSISLKKLVPSPRNVRKSSDDLADLQLRADIAARGLLQNLVVRKAKRGKFEVEAGGRRLAALQALAEEGTLPETHEVTCLVIEGEESEVREDSLAENFQRLAMNPADEAQAFASIIDAGDRKSTRLNSSH